MIKPSPEIEAIVRRMSDTIRSHEVADLPHYFSNDEAVLYVGTAEDETWRGQILRDGISAHLAEVPDFTEEDVEIEAWEHGDVGWAFRQTTYRFADTGVSGKHRISFVFVMEQGRWKVIQHHISNPTSNLDKMGVEHRAFRDLLAAAEDEQLVVGLEGLSSIMFTDIANSTALAEAVGDRIWHGVLAEHLTAAEEIITLHGGRLVKSLGDGTMSAFPSARGAMSAALALQDSTVSQASEPPLSIRIGIHTGEVIATDDDYFGVVVNKAARIAASARPDETRVSDATRLMAGNAPDFGFSNRSEIPLKGLEGSHAVHVLEKQA
ncbi:nuclear transport factor 2 family protein [uncultured Shimia sp.]|uniref:nuclear transport factor 2 family protein n=1 Tax=uncultured Shimia sp. TaxID=573152 RepID=UPI002617987B|nr:nuclear transport factor 2 family protein [uncultured Shimia sp.]